MAELANYSEAVRAIKSAILRSQYEAAKSVNARQLALYYSIGGYISQNSRAGQWGTGAIDAISAQLQKELPGLRGFSATNLKNMRLFFEAWAPAVLPLTPNGNSSVATDELGSDGAGEIRHLQLPNLDESLSKAFITIGFTHHITILSGTTTRDKLLFYIRECARNHYSVAALKRARGR